MSNKQIIGFFLTLIFIISGCAVSETIQTWPITTTITSEPPNAEIYWGEVENGLIKTSFETPYLEYSRTQDWYYQVKKEGYRDSQVVFSLMTKGDRLVHFKLEPLDSENTTDSEKADYQYGAFTILSDPAGAHVVLKETGEYIGMTPTEVRFFQRDNNRESNIVIQQFILNKRGFQPIELTLNLICDYSTKSKAVNNPKSIFAMLKADDGYSVYSTVKIASEPPGASIYRGGYLLGQTPLEYDFHWKSPSISHELIFEKSGFDSKSAVLKSDDKGIMIVLQPSSTTPE